MDEKITQWKAAVAAVGGLLTGLWGWLGWLVLGWIAAMALDYISGSAAACKTGNWSSAHAREGIWHKAGMIVVVLVASGADLLIDIVLSNLTIVQLPVQYPGLICPMVLVWYIITELGSIVENAVRMGAIVPNWLKKLLEISRDAVDKAGDKLIGENEEEENEEEC